MSADRTDDMPHPHNEGALPDRSVPRESQPQSRTQNDLRDATELSETDASAEPRPAPGSAESPVITVCPKGPLLVRGDFLMAAEPGAEPLPPERKVIALCRCGMTSIAPHCDGSHKLAKVRAFMPRKDRD